MKTIKIKYHTDIEPIKKILKGDWIDLRATDNLPIMKGDNGLISLGVSMELPEGFEAHVVPRSSTFKTWGLIQTNGVGIIDNSYCGDNDVWHFPFYATKEAFVKKGDRICQFRIFEKQPEIEFEVVKSLGNKNRGGLGSTGVN